MELFRRREKNKLTNDIRTNENFIKRSQETISRLIISSSDPFVLNQIEKLKNAIEEKTLSIENMKKELIDVETGVSDEKINSQYKEQNKKQEKNIKDKLTEKTNEKKVEKEKHNVAENYRKGISTSAFLERQKEKDYNYGCRTFYKITDSLPPYIRKNLAEMPNNKGYVWRDLHFYGSLPEEQGPRVMFEKIGNILVIHEHTDKEYKRYEKSGRDKKILVFKQIKKKKQQILSIMDYVK
jgi:hypothetical protein